MKSISQTWIKFPTKIVCIGKIDEIPDMIFKNWVLGNQNPENSSFRCGGKEWPRMVFRTKFQSQVNFPRGEQWPYKRTNEWRYHKQTWLTTWPYPMYWYGHKGLPVPINEYECTEPSWWWGYSTHRHRSSKYKGTYLVLGSYHVLVHIDNPYRDTWVQLIGQHSCNLCR